jgi:CheY-like chemotaxis protein
MKQCGILIIDDDIDDVEILAEAFNKSGVEGVHYVHTAMQAFMYLQSTDMDCLPKLIVTDYYLPGISGPEFLKDLKAMPKYRDIPVVILSTTKSEKEIENYKALGMLEYIQKPNTYEEYMKVAAILTSKIKLQ